MACGITVAPRIEAAISTESVPWKRGIRPRTTAAGSGGATNRPAMNPKVMTSSNTMMIRSNVVCVLPPWNHSITVEAAADHQAADEQRQPEQQIKGDRAADHLGQIGGDGDDLGLHKEHEAAASLIRSPSSSGRDLLVTMPSLAD